METYWKNEQHKRIWAGCDENTFIEDSDRFHVVNIVSPRKYQLSQPLSWGHEIIQTSQFMEENDIFA